MALEAGYPPSLRYKVAERRARSSLSLNDHPQFLQDLKKVSFMYRTLQYGGKNSHILVKRLSFIIQEPSMVFSLNLLVQATMLTVHKYYIKYEGQEIRPAIGPL